MIDRIMSALFRSEEINGGHRCPTYLYRWTLFQPGWAWLGKWRGFGVYLHKFVGDDWSTDLHDHPKRFISIGLWGSYREERLSLGHGFMPRAFFDDPRTSENPTGKRLDHNVCGRHLRGGYSTALDDIETCNLPPWAHTAFVDYRAPWVRTFPAEHTHRLTGPTHARPCWTLVVVLANVRAWGFLTRAGTWIGWRGYVNSADADKARSCAGGEA